MNWLNHAATLAHATQSFGNAKVAATLIYRNRLIAYGTNNNPKSHPLAKFYGKNDHAIYLHAELSAILNADRRGFTDWHRATLYVARVLKSGQIAIAKPCEGCQRAIQAYGVRDTYYTIR